MRHFGPSWVSGRWISRWLSVLFLFVLILVLTTFWSMSTSGNPESSLSIPVAVGNFQIDQAEPSETVSPLDRLVTHIQQKERRLAARSFLASSQSNMIVTNLARVTDEQNPPSCAYPSPHLVGEVLPPKHIQGLTPSSEKDLEKELSYLLPGGCWKPSDCRAHNGSLAVIIPSHGRHRNLLVLLRYLVPLLKRQQQDFCIYTGNQSENSAGTRFNKGAVVDALFVEAMKERNWTCVCVHDVDLVPENDHNSYSCPHAHIKNLMGAIDKFGYSLPYPQVFGGGTISMSHHFRMYNGLTTAYWGWGSEDDDHRMRLGWAGLSWVRSPVAVGRYTHIPHDTSPTNPDRFAMVPHAKDLWKHYGLNTLKYTVEHKTRTRLFTTFVLYLPKQGDGFKL